MARPRKPPTREQMDRANARKRANRAEKNRPKNEAKAAATAAQILTCVTNGAPWGHVIYRSMRRRLWSDADHTRRLRNKLTKRGTYDRDGHDLALIQIELEQCELASRRLGLEAELLAADAREYDRAVARLADIYDFGAEDEATNDAALEDDATKEGVH